MSQRTDARPWAAVTSRDGERVPLGATWDGTGVAFALRSRHATRVELCLFERGAADSRSARPTRSIDLVRADEGGAWTTRVAGLAPGALYGYRVHGPWAPTQGQRFNPAKLLIDPWARAIGGPADWHDALRAHRGGPAPSELEPEPTDSAPWVPRSVVVDPAFDWQGDLRPNVPWSRTVVYEAHVKGLTMLHPELPPAARGRYLGLAHPAVIEHLRALGVTTVELLPVHHAAIEAHLARLGLVNYWGYSSVGYFAPDARFATGALGEQVREFKTMVRELHRAGLEVVLDVVYNHTGEGDGRGATLCLRGVDNAVYYRQHPTQAGEYEDFTGCGNSLDVRQEAALELVLGSLRYWAEEMHVDGFRFDLAPVLLRDPFAPDPAARFLAALRADPLLGRLKLIAEPWDLGPQGFQLGAFPSGWAEWNSLYRDTVRDFWRSDRGDVGRLSFALAGSREVFEPSRRGPCASIGYVTCHDGFTLRDLVSYDVKHNLRNGEGDRDGPDDNRSRNWGVEGPTTDPEIEALRERARRSLLATLALSHGVPMISHGDELGRTQGGNNNAYCHDDETTWLRWVPAEGELGFLEFTRQAFALRAENAVFRRRSRLTGTLDAEGRKDVTWLDVHGHEMTPESWRSAPGTLGMLLPAAFADALDEHGAPQRARTALVLVNGSAAQQAFRLPTPLHGRRWVERLSTSPGRRAGRVGEQATLSAHSLLVLELLEAGEAP